MLNSDEKLEKKEITSTDFIEKGTVARCCHSCRNLNCR